MFPLWQQSSAEKRILGLAFGTFLLDQATKFLVERTLAFNGRQDLLPGFFSFVHWGNTGSAWSLFHGNNLALAAVAVVALGALWWGRRQFEAHRPPGQVALGLLFGGITGNLLDRLLPHRQHVVDFLFFHLHPRGGGEAYFPAFNVADVAICSGVGLLLIYTWHTAPADPSAA
jgi:signal peptidase II